MFVVGGDSEDEDRLQKYRNDIKDKKPGKLLDELNKHYIIRLKLWDNFRLYVANSLPNILQNVFCGSVCF